MRQIECRNRLLQASFEAIQNQVMCPQPGKKHGDHPPVQVYKARWNFVSYLYQMCKAPTKPRLAWHVCPRLQNRTCRCRHWASMASGRKPGVRMLRPQSGWPWQRRAFCIWGFLPFCHKCLGKPAHAVLMPASSFATPYGPTSRKKSLRERAQARPYWNPWQMACWEKLYPLLFLVNWWPSRCWTTLFCACPNFKWRHLLLWVGAALSSWVARIIEDIASPQPRL